MLIEDKVAIITGGNRGIGAATAKRFAKEGAKVVITYSSGKSRAKADETINGIDGIAVKCDVTQADDVKNLIGTAIEKFGRLDILVNNAGIIIEHSISEFDEKAVTDQIATNVIGPIRCTAAAVNELVKTRGVIVNTTSIVGLSPSFISDIYAATKHALTGLTRSWALELGPKGVRVNSVAPSATRTDIFNDLADDTVKKMEALSPLGRLAQPEEIANAILFMASDMSSYINGQTLLVDSGRFMH